MITTLNRLFLNYFVQSVALVNINTVNSRLLLWLCYYLYWFSVISEARPIEVEYVVYPQCRLVDFHQGTAVAHIVHTGLLFEFPNGTFAELHYGQHKLGGWPQSYVKELINQRFSEGRRRAAYHIAPLPVGMSYTQAKQKIFDYWNRKSYWYGRYDSWRFVEWFAEEIGVRPAKLKGPIGTYLLSPKRHSRTLVGLFSHLFDLSKWPSEKLASLLADAYIILIEEQDYFIITNLVTAIRKIINTLLKEVIETPSRQLAKLGIPVITIYLAIFVGFSYWLYRRRLHRPEIFDKALQQIVNCKKLGPEEYFPASIIANLVNDINDATIKEEHDRLIPEVYQAIARIPAKYRQVAVAKTPNNIQAYAGHRITTITFSAQDNAKTLFFYIPGTGSIGINSEVEMTNASHLAKALGSDVIYIEHGLAPRAVWPRPFYDVCEVIKKILTMQPNKRIGIVGYSSGGLLATLATLALLQLGFAIDYLALIAPLLDLSGEFRHINLRHTHLHQSNQYLPKTLQQNQAGLQKIRQDSFPNPARNPFYQHRFFKSLLKNTFTRSQLLNPQLLRRFSPNWWPSKVFAGVNFPATIFITGQNDYFRLDTAIMTAQLQQAAVNFIEIILPDINHAITWEHLYPLYFCGIILQQQLFPRPYHQRLRPTKILLNQLKRVEQSLQKLVIDIKEIALELQTKNSQLLELQHLRITIDIEPNNIKSLENDVASTKQRLANQIQSYNEQLNLFILPNEQTKFNRLFNPQQTTCNM